MQQGSLESTPDRLYAVWIHSLQNTQEIMDYGRYISFLDSISWSLDLFMEE